jgi:hypothetical protein
MDGRVKFTVKSQKSYRRRISRIGIFLICSSLIGNGLLSLEYLEKIKIADNLVKVLFAYGLGAVLVVCLFLMNWKER